MLYFEGLEEVIFSKHEFVSEVQDDHITTVKLIH